MACLLFFRLLCPSAGCLNVKVIKQMLFFFLKHSTNFVKSSSTSTKRKKKNVKLKNKQKAPFIGHIFLPLRYVPVIHLYCVHTHAHSCTQSVSSQHFSVAKRHKNRLMHPAQDKNTQDNHLFLFRNVKSAQTPLQHTCPFKAMI